MHITNDDEWRRPFNPVSGSSLTVGTIAKISDTVATLLAKIADMNRQLDRLEGSDESTARTVIEAQP